MKITPKPTFCNIHANRCVDTLDASMRGVDERDLYGETTVRMPGEKPMTIEQIQELSAFIQESWRRRRKI